MKSGVRASACGWGALESKRAKAVLISTEAEINYNPLPERVSFQSRLNRLLTLINGLRDPSSAGIYTRLNPSSGVYVASIEKKMNKRFIAIYSSAGWSFSWFSLPEASIEAPVFQMEPQIGGWKDTTNFTVAPLDDFKVVLGIEFLDTKPKPSLRHT